ncbi:MAG: PQQ-dependent sugar dehydrogenase [Methanomicrobiales archaeon]|nr:PQQ-dependent sugar dehydrogenase [Methanomicrobiales archaeon]
MKKQLVFLSLLLVMATLAAFAGCATQQAAPMITITSPQNGATVPAGSVPVTVQVSNLNIVDKQGQANVAGEGHVHFYLDIPSPPSAPGQPAIPANAQLQWAHVSGTSYTFTNVPPGTHTITVQLVNNDHSPIIPLAVATATVTVSPPVTTPGPTTTVTPAPGPDLTNQNSPEAATYTAYPSRTKLHTPDVSVGLKFVAGGFISPMMVVPAPDTSGRLFLVDQTGVVNIFYANGTVLPQPFLDLRDRMIQLDPTYDERGLLSMAFHPQYTTNGRVFVYYSAPLRAGVDPNWSCTNHLSEFHVSAQDPNRLDNTTEKVLLMVDKPYENHNGGTLLFGPDDGYLYLPLGDGGRADDTGMGHTPGIGNGQDLTKILGKVIRIDVDHTSAGKLYAIPGDNPFVSTPGAMPEIFAYGFRNPAYATFDSAGSHRMFISMAGQRLFESVLVIYRGGDYPWNIREGTHCFNPANDFTPPPGPCNITGYSGQPLIGPVVELGHDVGDVIVGGVLYRGTGIPSLQGKFVYGTWSDENRIVGNGTLLVATPPAGLSLSSLPMDATALTPAENAMWTTQQMKVANNPNGRINAFILRISEDRNHEILVLINQNGGPGLLPHGSGEVWQVVPSTTPNLEVTTAHLTPTPTPTQPSTSGLRVTLQLTQKGDKFSPSTLTAPAGALATLVLNDQDLDPHNFALYSSLSSSNALFRTPVVTGPVTNTYTFTVPFIPGTYYYRSDPNVGMLGTLTVTAPSTSGGGGGGGGY